MQHRGGTAKFGFALVDQIWMFDAVHQFLAEIISMDIRKRDRAGQMLRYKQVRVTAFLLSLW